ncbi:MAG: hypothetical protein LBN99_07150 [Oscillospiraceae bacterium]|jgi:hypothetical protein|nr:hypothetical protein [Oscillospiraceae bacterium]
MTDKEYDAIVSKVTGSRAESLSGNDIYALKQIVNSGAQPWSNRISSFLDRAASGNTDALLVKKALGKPLSQNEEFKLNEAIQKSGRRVPG